MMPVEIMKVPIHPVTNKSIVPIIHKYLQDHRLHTVMTPNPEMVMLSQRNPALMEALKNADLVIPDGIGIILAARVKRLGIKERVTGIDTMETILSLCEQTNHSFFLLGGKPGRAEKAVANIQKKKPGIKIAGYYHGYFKQEEEQKVLDLIINTQPDVLFVCLGSPRQEIWIHHYRDTLPAKLVMGVGGSVDVYAGEVRRAPQLLQRMGLEWLYRTVQEPSRLKRLGVLPIFLWKVLRESLLVL